MLSTMQSLDARSNPVLYTFNLMPYKLVTVYHISNIGAFRCTERKKKWRIKVGGSLWVLLFFKSPQQRMKAAYVCCPHAVNRVVLTPINFIYLNI